MRSGGWGDVGCRGAAGFGSPQKKEDRGVLEGIPVFVRRLWKYPKLAERRAARGVNGRDRLRIEVPLIAVLLERWLDREHNLGSMVARTIKLLDAYGARVLRAAVDDMLADDLVDLGALAVLPRKLTVHPGRVGWRAWAGELVARHRWA
jgi:hypothetical protein